MKLSRRNEPNPGFLVIAKRKYNKNYVKKVVTDTGVVRIYDDAHIKQRWKKKVRQIKALKSALPKLQKRYRQDLKSDDPKVVALAAVAAILDLTAMRIGNDGSVDEFGTFGATTLKKKHLSFSGNKVRFKFLGKRQVDQKFELTDALVAKSLKSLVKGKGPNDFVFEYDDGHRIRAKVVNRYLAEFNITAKDLRGFHANRMMREELKKTNDFDKALENVAEEVGHEPKTLMNQYLDPAIVKLHKRASADDSIIPYVNMQLRALWGGAGTAAHPPLSRRAPPSSPAAPAAPVKSPASGQLAGKQRITSPFGKRKDPITGRHAYHGGVDLPAKSGTPVFAVGTGVVKYSGFSSGSGNMVSLLHGADKNVESQYMHLSKSLVKSGQSVTVGQLIGYSGATGRVTGPHLHFVIKFNGKAVNPTKILYKRVILGS